MYYCAYISLIVAMLVAFGAAVLALFGLWKAKYTPNVFVEKAHLIVSLALLFASACLLHALFWQDYSLQYAAQYTDKHLSLFYRLTAFWAGQPGSLLFWTLVVSLFATFFALSKSYARLHGGTRLWFWLFQHTILVFFIFLLATYSNPFIVQTPAPLDGNGLNPLLQNPGMIIHPPLLFIGYAGFFLPTCLAFAEHLHTRTTKDFSEEREFPWFRSMRPYILFSWVFLTAGILLGAWWAYMELGWGGYWAWDPVENSSLIPWLLATALLHTLALERRKKNFSRFNLFLLALTSASTLFATYLVRSGVIDSVHAFGQGAVGTPLLIGLSFMLLVALGLVCSEAQEGEPITDVLSRDAFLSFMSWFLLALAAIIALATMWPVITRLFSATRGGLDAAFYNRVCLPLAAILLAFLAFCPWLGNKREGARNVEGILLACVFFATLLGMYVLTPYRNPVALLATAAGGTIILGVLVKVVRCVRLKTLHGCAALGAHFGLAFCAIGIAFSGPYSLEKDILFTENESALVDDYLLTLKSVRQEDGPGYAALVVRLAVEKDDKELGVLVPERRIYEKFGDMQFSEVDTLFSLGEELYVSLLGLTADKKVLVRFSIKPLVNWLWFGGFCMSLLPLVAFFRKRDDEHLSSGEDASRAQTA